MKRLTKLLLSCRTFRDSLVQPLRFHHQINTSVMKRVSASVGNQSDFQSGNCLVPVKNDTFIMYLDKEMRDQLVSFLNKQSSKSDLYNKENYVLMMTKTTGSNREAASEKLGPLICLEEMNQALQNADAILKTQVSILNDMKRLLNIMKETTKNAKLDEKIQQIDQQIADVILLSKNNHRLTKQYSNIRNRGSEKKFDLDNKKAVVNYKNIFQNSGKMFWRILNKHKLLDSHIRTIYDRKMQVLCSKNKLMDANYTSLVAVKSSSGKLLRHLSPKSVKSKMILNDNMTFLNALRTDFKDFMWGIHLLNGNGQLESTTNEICDKLNKMEKTKEELQQIILDASQGVMRLNKRFAENVKMLVKIEKFLRNISRNYKFDNYQTFIITYFLKEKLKLIKNSFLSDCMTICLNKKYLRLFEKTALNETLYEEQKEIFVNDCKRMFSVVYGSNSGKSIQNIFTNSYFSSSSQKMMPKSNSALQPVLKKSRSGIELRSSRNFSSNQGKELFFSAELKDNSPLRHIAEVTIKDLMPEVEKKKEVSVQKINLNKVFVQVKDEDQKHLDQENANRELKISNLNQYTNPVGEIKTPSPERKLLKQNKETTTVRNASTQEAGMKFIKRRKQKPLETKVIVVKETDSKSIKTDVINSQEFEKIGIDESTQSQIKSISTDLNPTIEKQTADQNIGTDPPEVDESIKSKDVETETKKSDLKKPVSKSLLANQKILEKIKANRERNIAQPHSWKDLPEFAIKFKTKQEEPKRDASKIKKPPKSAVPVPQPKIDFKLGFSRPQSRKKLQTVKDIKYPDASKAKKSETKTDTPKKVFKIFTCQTDENLEVKSEEFKGEGNERKNEEVSASSGIESLIKTLPDHLEQRVQSLCDSEGNVFGDQIKNITNKIKIGPVKRIPSLDQLNANKAKDNLSARNFRDHYEDDVSQCFETKSRRSLDDCSSRVSVSSKQRLPKVVALKTNISRKFSFDKIPLRRKESSMSLVKGKLFSFKQSSTFKSSTLLSKDNIENSSHSKPFQNKYKKSGKWGVDLSLSGQPTTNEQVRYKGSAHSIANDGSNLFNRSKK